MRLVFAHDHRFCRGPGGRLYSLGSFPASLWERYLEHFDEVCVLARDGGIVSDEARLSRSDRGAIAFELLPSLSTLRQLLFRSRSLDARVRSIIEFSDAVVARLPSEIGLLAVRHARRLNKPYAIEVVGCAWDGLFHNGALSARMYAGLGYLRNRHAIAEAPLVLYVTSSWLQERYPTGGRSEIASNVYLRPMDPEGNERREERLAQLVNGRRPVLGTVASLYVKSKGIQTALKSLARLRSFGLDLEYRVLGAGPPHPWRELAGRFGIADLVHFDGTQTAGNGVLRWLDEIDVHLQPSFQEGLPRATLEAMSRGAACIGSTCGGIPELLPPERLHRPGDVAGLGRIIQRLATDPAAVEEASEADRDTARRYDLEELQERRRRFYSQLREKVGKAAG